MTIKTPPPSTLNSKSFWVLPNEDANSAFIVGELAARLYKSAGNTLAAGEYKTVDKAHKTLNIFEAYSPLAQRFYDTVHPDEYEWFMDNLIHNYCLALHS